MAEHVWSVLCHKTLIEPGTQLLSLFEVVEKVTLEQGELERLAVAQATEAKAILLPLQVQVVSFWLRSEPSKPETSEGRVLLINPAGEVAVERRFAINLDHESGGFRQIVGYKKLPMASLGRYWFVTEQRRPPSAEGQEWFCETRIPVDIEGESGTAASTSS